MNIQALGMVETFGYIGAVEAADICLKSANVSLIDCVIGTGGLVTIKITGDVGAVNAAIDGAKAAVVKVGKLISTHVIPKPAIDTVKLLCVEELKQSIRSMEDKLQSSYQERENSQKCESPCISAKEELLSMKVVDLRSLARQTDGISMDKNEIKFARKEELIKAILECFERKSD